MRTILGVNFDHLSQHGVNIEEFRKKLEERLQHLKDEHIIIDSLGMRLRPSSFVVSNFIISDILNCL